MSILTPYLQAFPRFGHFVGGLGGDPDPPPTFDDFNDINTLFWYSLHPSAALVSSLSFGSGVSQLTDVSGNGHTIEQSTGANQPAYNATGLNGFPCLVGTVETKNLFFPFVGEDYSTAPNMEGCTVLAVVEVADSISCAGLVTLGLGDPSGDLFAGLSAAVSPSPSVGTPVTINVASKSSTVGVARWTMVNSNFQFSWNGGTAVTDTTIIDVPASDPFTIFRFQGLTLYPVSGGSPKIGEVVAMSPAASTPSNITQAISILKSRWGIA